LWFDPDEGTTLLQNAGNYLPVDKGNNPEDLNLPYSKLMHTIPQDELGSQGTGIW
jgi:hypothetical protein